MTAQQEHGIATQGTSTCLTATISTKSHATGGRKCSTTGSGVSGSIWIETGCKKKKKVNQSTEMWGGAAKAEEHA